MTNIASEVRRTEYQEIASLDPLRLDAELAQLPHRNAAQDSDGIIAVIATATDRFAETPITERREATAALRDLDFLASSALRHGRNPIEAVPGLEPILLKLGEVALMVPRGTVTTYAMANPRCERRRSFTGSPEEEAFITSVTDTAEALEDALENMAADIKHGFPSLLDAMDTMVSSMVHVKRTVSPDFFTNQMRPYFDPLAIGGKEYLGSGGAQLQLVGIDLILWGADDTNEVYRAFVAENMPYLSAAQRTSIDRIVDAMGGKSISSSLEERYDPELAAFTLATLKRIRKFRYPHRRVAQDNFKLRPPDAVGSGSYDVSILDVLIEKTEHNIERVSELYDIEK